VDEPPLRIAIVGSARSLHTRRWARRLADRGHETHVYTVWPEPVEGVAMHDILGRPLPGGIGLRKLWRRRHLRVALEHLDPDVVQTHFLWPSGEWGWETGQRPIVQGAWGSDVLLVPATSAKRRALAERILGEADAVTVNSEVLALGVAGLGVPRERIHQIGWGVDTATYSGVRDRGLIDTIFPGRPVVASPRLHKGLYNLDVLMEAIPLTQRSVPDAAFLFMAYGPDSDRLREQAERLGVAGSVHFQRFAESDVPRVFAGCDLSVSIPSSDTGRPTSLLEAMASSLPVVVSDLPGIRELIDHGEGAEIVPVRDPEATAAAIVRLLQNAGLRERYGSRNRAVVVERASAAEETAKCLALYRRLSGR
jgi:glycosyltransferase involved in cell wall biosynthesis